MPSMFARRTRFRKKSSSGVSEPLPSSSPSPYEDGGRSFAPSTLSYSSSSSHHAGGGG
eukprot:CAMPEP_0113579756 /NCGR_PEP_ID=MMETSP0015_2-20120614/30259_1 /TAXON_ID=2838 /ORGANISM="Odontella" /LENGTH=57 /DNA_ID=CAMNT_0000483799 /DNA_START=411 /DNA_END=580 /DNA_ORIENTATION=+ /assembly_acc=CAM_ASM_000160